jgi:hypothetical protein
MKCFWEDPTLNPDDFYHAYLDRKNADWDKLYENYDAAVDWPTVSFYKELLARYPDAKVILTVRSADSWYKSVKNTIHKAALKASNVPPNHPMHSFNRMARTVCLGGRISDPEKFSDEETLKRLFLEHIEEVKMNVPADQLYVMELGEGWDGLCKFLEKEMPKEPYPNCNSTNEFSKDFPISEDSNNDTGGLKACT